MAYDAAHKVVVLFGGNSVSLGDLNDTWIWDGTNWTNVAPSVSPADNPAILNITFTYNGPTIRTSGSDVDLANGQFFVITSADNFSFTGFQASQSHTQPSDTEDSVSGAITVPGNATPEPTTFVLLGAGLIAFGFIRRRRIV